MATARRHQTAEAGMLRPSALPTLLILAALVIGISALLPLIQSSSATSTAGNVRALEAQRTDWRARSRALELEVARMGSLPRIETEAAARFGMRPPAARQYIAIDAPAPEQRRLPSRYAPEQSEEDSDSPSLIEDILSWVTP